MKIIANPVNLSATIKSAELPANKQVSPEVIIPAESKSAESLAADNFLAINNKIASASDIDMNKVNAVREMLREGTLTLDTQVLSAALLAMHRR